MEDPTRRGRHDLNLALRKAEEIALRRYQATHWLNCMVGRLGVSDQPTEKEFISSLRNGLVLCNLMNKIQPGSVPKVVEIHSPPQPLSWDSQPLPAYQYFENIRNFLVAVEELKLPAFEASVFEKDNIEVGSSAKVVDCIIALKAYYEWKEMSGGKGLYKPPRSPFFMDPARRIDMQSHRGGVLSDSCRKLDMSGCNTPQLPDSESKKLEDFIVKSLVNRMADSKENIDNNTLASLRQGNVDPVGLLTRILSNCLEEKLQNKFPELKSGPLDLRHDGNSSPCTASRLSENQSAQGTNKCCRACLPKNSCHHWDLVEIQERELLNLKALLSTTRKEFENLQSQTQSDLQLLAYQVHEMSTAALGYHQIVNENRILYNMVQDLKGNIRVYCRVRPAFNSQSKNVIEFIGNDGSLMVVDPLKPHKDGRKVFQFNHVFGPSATQDEVFQDTRPLIRSVMDGFNVCIFAYGQTGSGKTYTMSGPSGGLTKDSGINYLALNDLFQLSNERNDIMKYDIQVQMVEIYNEQVRDLLAEDSCVTKVEIRSCASDGGLTLPNAAMHAVKSTADVLNLMKLGDLNRAVGSTAINNRSSRSHSVLTVHVCGEDISGSKLRSCLHLVDLAGSERIDKSEVTGEALKEAQFINKSLSCLGDVIAALAQKNSHIPYRNSKLTLLLQNSLGGHAKTLMFAHVSPEADSFGETMSTLKFAQRASTVELGTARSNKESSEVIELKAEIENLKLALGSKDARTPQTSMAKEGVKTPYQKSKILTERTPPPRNRRLNIEDGSTMKLERTDVDWKKEVKTPPAQPPPSRRLSLEGPRYTNKDNGQVKLISKLVKPEVAYPDTDAVRKPFEVLTNGGSKVQLGCPRAPKSPSSSVVLNIDNRTKIPSFEPPKTPGPPAVSGNEARTASELRSSSSTISTTGKTSHLRKSLRTIGKLINGSEKRNQTKQPEVKEPFNGTSSIPDEAKSPIPASARALRRQSLTCILPPERSKRSSIGGANESRFVKTPPPVGAAVKSSHRWL